MAVYRGRRIAAKKTTRRGRGGVRWVDVAVRLVLDRLVAIAWAMDLSVAFCSWRYGLVRMYTPSLLYVAACICAVPFRFAESMAPSISDESDRRKAFMLGRIASVA